MAMSMLPAPILLQTRYQFLAKPDTSTTWIFAAIVVGFIVLLTVGSLLSRRMGGSMNPEQRRQYNRNAFFRMAKDLGLQKQHAEMLEYLIKACKVMQPFLVFSNAGLLDDLLRKGIYSIEKDRELSEEERERRMSTIFQIKQLIERSAKKGIGIRATTYLKPGQPMVMSPDSGGQFSTKVVSNMRDLLACSVPRNASGQEVRWNKGASVKVHLWRDNDAGYAFQSKILGYDSMKGVLCILIQHSKTLRREQHRQFRRKSLQRPCFFYPIQITEGKRPEERKAIVMAHDRHLGNTIDVSAGGCSISSVTPLKAGSLVKIEFEINRRERINIYGKVRRIRGENIRGGIMHIMFTKLSSQHLNRINSYVYNYSGQTTGSR